MADSGVYPIEDTMDANEISKPTSLEQRRAMSKALLEENMKDSSSWSIGNMTTIQEQARLYPDRFINNDAIFYDLSHRESLRQIHGSYAIVFAKRVKPRTGTHDYELFEPSSRENRFEIWTTKPDEEHDKKTRAIGRALNAGFAAAIRTYFQGLNYNFCIERSTTESTKYARVIFIDRQVDQVHRSSDLARTLRGNIIHDDSKIEFGVALQGSRRGSPDTILGFEFVSFQLREYGGRTGGEEITQVVAVKMPMGKDISSAFLLMQEIFYPRNVDWWIFSDDEQPAEDNVNDHKDDEMEYLIPS